jgi:hypothetical protein
MAERPAAPRTFFLNESHEHARGKKGGGGTPATFSHINWASKGQRVLASLRAVRTAVASSQDPLRETRFFMLSIPEESVLQDSKAKTAKDGFRQLAIEFDGDHARIFERLGLDLVQVSPSGNAIVHARPAALDQLEATAARLPEIGTRDRATWAVLSQFAVAPVDTRVDLEWLAGLNPKTAHEVIVEFQPVLNRAEVDRLIEAIQAVLANARTEAIVGAGRDPSGRRWVRAHVRPKEILELATGFLSIQAIHAPLRATLFSKTRIARGGGASSVSVFTPVTSGLPTVAVVDTGIPREHPLLAPYRRGEFRHPNADQGEYFDHGSRVASRVVFGDVTAVPAFEPPIGRCRYLDVVLPTVGSSDEEPEIDGKEIFEVLRNVVLNYTDVRVLNLSFGTYLALDQLPDAERFQRHLELQDLDNFVYENDVVVVVAAGNTRQGVVPNSPYPRHVTEPDWRLGGWAAGFNTLVVGGYVPRVNTDGVGRITGYPSPFTRIGPGVAKAPIPGYSASAGDCTNTYQWRRDFGVWTLSRSGEWEDVVGTSHAAPIIARESALLLHDLQKYCGPGVRPFASTAKAFLRLVARPKVAIGGMKTSLQKLVQRTLGAGRPDAGRLDAPSPDTAVFLWQGTLARSKETARVTVPVPRSWLTKAKEPVLRAVCAWNTPTNAAAPRIWACRAVKLQLRPFLDAEAPHGLGRASGAYPLIDKKYDLHEIAVSAGAPSDEWILEVSYEEVAPYPSQLVVSDEQRVSVVWELYDQADGGVGPQVGVQSLPLSNTMIRLGGITQPIWTPIRIRTN